MTLPVSTTPFLSQALIQILGCAGGVKTQAQGALATLQAGSVDTNWVYSLLDQINANLSFFTRFVGVLGLDAYAQAQIPGYSGSLVADGTAVVNALTDCRAWVVANFPKDSTNTFVLDYTLNSDGTRTARSFTPAMTAGLQTKLQTLIALIG